ncbi:DUF3099 domain-containing protein [Streptomyces sp. NPDC006992]|uniref:DUF3099 domain-containing protein n=1 Tax=Streptomyces sp. NPDC006992 TaxID=3155601 RepID=UPI0033E416FC
MTRKQHRHEVFRITGARQGLQEDVRGRQRRYVISMLVRTLAVILTVVLWNVERPLAVGTLVIGLTLPYIAVVIANAGRENAPSAPPAAPPPAPPQRTLEGSRVTKAGDETTPDDADRASNETASGRS